MTTFTLTSSRTPYKGGSADRRTPRYFPYNNIISLYLSTAGHSPFQDRSATHGLPSSGTTVWQVFASRRQEVAFNCAYRYAISIPTGCLQRPIGSASEASWFLSLQLNLLRLNLNICSYGFPDPEVFLILLCGTVNTPGTLHTRLRFMRFVWSSRSWNEQICGWNEVLFH